MLMIHLAFTLTMHIVSGLNKTGPYKLVQRTLAKGCGLRIYIYVYMYIYIYIHTWIGMDCECNP